METCVTNINDYLVHQTVNRHHPKWDSSRLFSYTHALVVHYLLKSTQLKDTSKGCMCTKTLGFFHVYCGRGGHDDSKLSRKD